MAKIAFFELEKWEQNYFAKHLKKHKLTFVSASLTSRSAKKISDCEVLVVFIHSKVNKAILDKLPKLKLVITMSTGFDHIDMHECKQRKIKVCNVPSYGENTVAEYAFALLLSISRNIHKTYEQTVRGNFSINTIRGFDLKGKTIGIIGAGKIGQHMIKMAKGFDMNVLAFSRHKNSQLAKKLGFKYASLDTLIKKSDVISLHLPYTPKTHHIINKQRIKTMKKGVILINTSRGGVIDTHALIYGLNKGIIGGAGLDVLESECFLDEEARLLKTRNMDDCSLRTMLENHMLLDNQKVIVTPHNAFNTTEAILRILETTKENILRFTQNKRLKTPIKN